MKKFLKHKFGRCLAPEFDGNGQIVRDRDGETRYVKMPQNVCIAIARRLCGNENPYLNPWFYHVDASRPEDDILICLDPNEPGRDNKQISRVFGNDNRKIADAIEAETQCPFFGTVKCDRQCTYCGYCEHIGTKKCRTCKKKCEECQLDNTTRVISRDGIFTADGCEVSNIYFDPPSAADIEGEYEGKEIQDALFAGLDALDDMQRSVIHYTYVGNLSERKIADKLGFKSKTQAVRLREKALSILREHLKNYRD